MKFNNYINRIIIFGYSLLVVSYLSFWMFSLAGDSLGDYTSGYWTPILMLAITICSILYVADSLLRQCVIYSGFVKLIFCWVLWMVVSATLFRVPDMSISRLYSTLLLWCACFLFGYYICLNYPRSFTYFKKAFIIFFVITIPTIIHLSIFRTSNSRINVEGYTASLNLVYFALLTAPWLLLTKKKIIQLFFMLILAGLILVSAKRSALIALLFILIPYVYLWLKNTHKKLVGVLILILAGGVFLAIFAPRLDFLELRLKETTTDEGSGRVTIWKDTIQRIQYSSIEGLILGHGYDSVRLGGGGGEYAKNHYYSAHNDFLEVIYDYGIVGFLLYLSIYFFLIRRMIFWAKKDSRLFLSYYSSFAIMLVMSTVSHLIIYPTFFIILTIYWGAMEANVFLLQKKAISRIQLNVTSPMKDQ